MIDAHIAMATILDIYKVPTVYTDAVSESQRSQAIDFGI
jgi:hypothetical protein